LRLNISKGMVRVKLPRRDRVREGRAGELRLIVFAGGNLEENRDGTERRST